jgi:hypothetical protein
VGLALARAPQAAAAAMVVVDNGDGPGEGFNDAAPCAPVGGNGATTLGEARLAAFRFAAALWAARLESAVPIHVDAAIDPLTCTPTSALLGSAGTVTVHRDFPAAPLPGTFYPQALANALAGVDLDPASPDIAATFSSALDGGTCLGGSRWYYGLDGAPPPGDLDFVTVVLHELAHGLGFQTFVALPTGAKFLGHDDVYMQRLEQHGAVPPGYPAMTNAQRIAASTSDPDLGWVGPLVNARGAATLLAGLADGRVRIHAPAPQQPGSSVSHFSTALAPDQLMEPFYAGPDHDLELTLALLFDLGWRPALPSPPVSVPASSGAALAVLGLALATAAARALRPSHAPAGGRARRRTAPGGWPMKRLNARLNAASDS